MGLQEVGKVDDELKKIDILRQRIGVSYREAISALERHDGDVVEALIELEERSQHWNHKVAGKGHEIVGVIKKYIHKGNETSIKVKKDNETVFEFPATVGALGILGAVASSELAFIGVLGTATAMAKNYSLEICNHKEEHNEHNDHNEYNDRY